MCVCVCVCVCAHVCARVSTAYHSKCIDPWLTKRKRTCPQCKRRVIPGQETDSESENEGEGEVATENTPLLSNNNAGHPSSAHQAPRSRSSTFERSGMGLWV